LHITRHLAPLRCPTQSQVPSAAQCSGNLGQFRQFTTVSKNAPEGVELSYSKRRATRSRKDRLARAVFPF
jgi:hypothetical protein